MYEVQEFPLCGIHLRIEAQAEAVGIDANGHTSANAKHAHPPKSRAITTVENTSKQTNREPMASEPVCVFATPRDEIPSRKRERPEAKLHQNGTIHDRQKDLNRHKSPDLKPIRQRGLRPARPLSFVCVRRTTVDRWFSPGRAPGALPCCPSFFQAEDGIRDTEL